MQRLRVDELAERADVSVDTIRFYQKRHLLAAPPRVGRVAWYGPEHLERLARIRELQNQGLTLALIGRVLSGDLDATDAPLAAAVADAEAPEEFLSLAELAVRSGVPPALLEAVAREGLLVPRAHDGGERYTASDVTVPTRTANTGTPTTLRLSDFRGALETGGDHNSTNWALDAVSVTQTGGAAAPEASTFTLMSLTLAAFGWRRWKG